MFVSVTPVLRKVSLTMHIFLNVGLNNFMLGCDSHVDARQFSGRKNILKHFQGGVFHVQVNRDFVLRGYFS